MTRTLGALFTACMIVLVAGCGNPPETDRIFPTSALVNPNTATQAELATVSGLSETAVTAIMAGRPFATPTALHVVIGAELTEATQQSVYEAMFVPVGLNSGAEDDYKLIPSTLSPGHLAHEFEEYRPYESMDQFKKEMSKYVTPAEVEFLTRYVTLD